MEQHTIYWASAALQSEFAHACTEAAKKLSETGIRISCHRLGSCLSFSSAELGNLQLDQADIFGFLKPQRTTALESLLIITVSAIDPTLLLLAHDRGRPCSPESKRNFLQNAISHLEKEQAERIMVAYDLHAESHAPGKPACHFGKSCQTLAA